ncbi:MFS transporter [Micromonospora polyrhachis]|uniref:Putative MFS family arabinose efflux permease n=1 Tax=Micromonospora polyrhachis TaxID=1282883 RepID=A0A7W7WQX5_9ACTN|nr:MFS transporter [Micromonospora polyrhachis]MBB4960470.1 putative MFS family arabinose efflux permease [Micromonospora polyrhachis]
MSDTSTIPPDSTPAGGTGAWSVLRAPQTARVLGASLLGRLPQGAAPLALLIFARETMSLTVAGLLVAAYTAGMAVGQPLLARIADRWRQPPVLWSGVLVSTAGFVLTAAGAGLPATLLGAALAGLGAPPFEAGLRVLWRDLLPAHQVHTAYTLDTATQEIIFVAGPMVTLAATQVAGPVGGLAAAALFQALGTALFVTAPAVRRWRGEPAVRHWAGPLRAGRLRLILVALLLVGAAVGSVTVAVTSYAEAAGDRSLASWLLAAQAGGALIGGLLYIRFAGLRARNTLLRATGAYAVGFLPLLLTPALPGMLALMLVSGLALSPLLTIAFVSIDSVAPAGTAAEGFAWAATAFSVGSAVGSAVDGVLLDTTGEVTVGFLLAPIVVTLACLPLLFKFTPPGSTEGITQ